MANLTSNTASLQEILAKVNALPEAGGGGTGGGGTAAVTIAWDGVDVNCIVSRNGAEWDARRISNEVSIDRAVDVGTTVFLHYSIQGPETQFTTTGAVEVEYGDEEYAVLKVDGDGSVFMQGGW